MRLCKKWRLRYFGWLINCFRVWLGARGVFETKSQMDTVFMYDSNTFCIQFTYLFVIVFFSDSIYFMSFYFILFDCYGLAFNEGILIIWHIKKQRLFLVCSNTWSDLFQWWHNHFSKKYFSETAVRNVLRFFWKDQVIFDWEKFMDDFFRCSAMFSCYLGIQIALEN